MSLYMLIAFSLLCAGAYYICPRRLRWLLLLAASYAFYAVSGARALPFILLTTLSTWAGALLIGRTGERSRTALKAGKGTLSPEEKKALKAAAKRRQRALLVLTLVLNFGVLAPNIRYFIDNHVKGVFEEGSTSNYGGTEFAEMRAWIIAKLLWNPDQDAHALAGEFIDGVYGQAAPFVRQYYDLLRAALESSPDTHFGLYALPEKPYITPEVCRRAEELFDRAELAAEDEIIRERVRVARLPVRFFALYTQDPATPGRDEAIEAFRRELESRCLLDIMEGRTLDYAIDEMKRGPQKRA